jgi:hypothetical protein
MTVLGCIAVYFLVGLLYARSQYLRLWRRQRDKNVEKFGSNCDTYATEDARMMAAWRVPAWPCAIVWDLFSGPFGRWFSAPVERRLAHADQLAADAAAWEKTARHATTDAEREMAVELARICRERAEETAP